jgi:hypothetical protein
MNERCLVKKLRFDVEVSLYHDMFLAAGYEDTDEGHLQLVNDLLRNEFKNYEFDSIHWESPPFELTWVSKSECVDSEVWEEE